MLKRHYSQIQFEERRMPITLGYTIQQNQQEISVHPPGEYWRSWYFSLGFQYLKYLKYLLNCWYGAGIVMQKRFPLSLIKMAIICHDWCQTSSYRRIRIPFSDLVLKRRGCILCTTILQRWISLKHWTVLPFDFSFYLRSFAFVIKATATGSANLLIKGWH